jgi:hypothetical protein
MNASKLLDRLQDCSNRESFRLCLHPNDLSSFSIPYLEVPEDRLNYVGVSDVVEDFNSCGNYTSDNFLADGGSWLRFGKSGKQQCQRERFLKKQRKIDKENYEWGTAKNK